MQKPFSLVIAVIVLVLGAAGMLWFHFNSKDSVGEPVACTMEAKICPDGSAVGRQGPRCEFAVCPTSTIPDGWVSTTTNGVTFSYPTSFDSDYIHPQTWPPQVTVTAGPYMCQSMATSSDFKIVSERIINGQQYCVTKQTEGAAGSSYTDYVYVTARDQQLITLKATIRMPQCLNYDEPRRSACTTEQQAFNFDTLVDTIIRTVSVSEVSAVPQRIMAIGEYVCLPHRDTTGPQTEECAFGIKADNGNYYALDFGVLQASDVLMTLQAGNRIKVEGSMVPAMALSSDHWQRYPIVGVISVTMLNRQ